MENHGGNHGLGRWQHPDCTAETQSGAGGCGRARISHRGGWASAGKVFVFGILQRYFGEPSGYRLRWPRLGLLGIEHQG